MIREVSVAEKSLYNIRHTFHIFCDLSLQIPGDPTVSKYEDNVLWHEVAQLFPAGVLVDLALGWLTSRGHCSSIVSQLFQCSQQTG